MRGQSYPEVMKWIKEYARSDCPDKQAVKDFVECEPDDRIRTLKNQFHAISKGMYDDIHFDKLIGPEKKAKYGTYANWARTILLWLNEMTKKA